jgi:RNA polymerase sigma factor (sigma-70 family)
MEEVIASQIWNYIGMLGVDSETARDLYQEAETAIWEAAKHRATDDTHSYFVKTGIGAIRHWLRDRYSLVRIPGYLHDRGEATSHMKTIVPLEDMNETVGTQFEDDLVERLDVALLRQRVIALLPRLTKAERQVMDALLTGRSIREIAKERRVRVGCVYAQRSKAILKLRNLLAAERKREEERFQPPIQESLRGGEARTQPRLTVKQTTDFHPDAARARLSQMKINERRFLEELLEVAQEFVGGTSTSAIVERDTLQSRLAAELDYREDTIGVMLDRFSREHEAVMMVVDDSCLVEIETLKLLLEDLPEAESKEDLCHRALVMTARIAHECNPYAPRVEIAAWRTRLAGRLTIDDGAAGQLTITLQDRLPPGAITVKGNFHLVCLDLWPPEILAEAEIDLANLKQPAPAEPLSPRGREDRRTSDRGVSSVQEERGEMLHRVKRSAAEVLPAIRAAIQPHIVSGRDTVEMKNLMMAIAQHFGKTTRGAGSALLDKVMTAFPKVVTMSGQKSHMVYTIDLAALRAAEQASLASKQAPVEKPAAAPVRKARTKQRAAQPGSRVRRSDHEVLAGIIMIAEKDGVRENGEVRVSGLPTKLGELWGLNSPASRQVVRAEVRFRKFLRRTGKGDQTVYWLNLEQAKAEVASAGTQAEPARTRAREPAQAQPAPQPLETAPVPTLDAEALPLVVIEKLISQDDLELAGQLLGKYLDGKKEAEIVHLAGECLLAGNKELALAIANARPKLFARNT